MGLGGIYKLRNPFLLRRDTFGNIGEEQRRVVFRPVRNGHSRKGKYEGNDSQRPERRGRVYISVAFYKFLCDKYRGDYYNGYEYQ